MATSDDGGTRDAGTADDATSHLDAARNDISELSGAADAVGAGSPGDQADGDAAPTGGPARRRRRGSRGGRNRKRPAADGSAGDELGDDHDDDDDRPNDHGDEPAFDVPAAAVNEVELPDPPRQPRFSPQAAEQALVRRPQIGDTRPAPAIPPPGPAVVPGATGAAPKSRSSAKGGAARAAASKSSKPAAAKAVETSASADSGDAGPKKKRRRTKGAATAEPFELDAETAERRRGKERNGRPLGRYLMCVQVRSGLTQVAVLEGRNLIEHYVSRPADDVSQIHGNIYLGKVQNVLPGMEAAFVDIGTPKNAVLYRGGVQYDPEDIEASDGPLRIEQMIRARQMIVCQVTKNPIGAKGARLTQEVSLPGRFVVLIPNSKTYGISKRLPDDVRKRLRGILDRVRPAEHGLIVRTAAEHASEHELLADVTRLVEEWKRVEAKAAKANTPTLLYREPELAVRVIREEFNADYRGVIIDDAALHREVHSYVNDFNPELADRIEFDDPAQSGLPLFERHHVHEQLHKALDRKVWLPSGGSLIIEHTEALTVIDVNTGKNVGKTNLEETVFQNNLEAAEEVAKQLRLRDIGGIVVIDFIDMEIRDNRKKVLDAFRAALARDKTRTQVFDISELGLVEMTRKRIGEGLLVNFADQCPNCQGRGVIVDHSLLD